MRTGFRRTVLAALIASAATIGTAQARTPADTLVYGTSLAQVISLDPHQGQDVTALEIMANLYDRLVASTPDGKLVPQLAASWEVDASAITFHLRPEARFASGRPVTAEDVVWSLTRLMQLNQAPASKLSLTGYTKDNIADLLHVIDPHTLRIDLTGDVAGDLLMYRLSEVATSVVDRDLVEPNDVEGDLGNAWLRNHAAGSGPFSLQAWRPNDIVLMNARPDYWGGAPELSRVVMRHVPESQIERLMLERGDIDIAGALSSGDIAYFRDAGEVGIQAIPTGGFYVLAMNMEKPELADPLVREAIFRSIDYAGIQSAILGPYGTERHVPVPAGYADAVADPPDWSFDPDAAKALLAESGYPEGFALTIKTINQTPRVEIATAVQAGLARIGIRASVVQGSGADIVSQHRGRDFDILIPQTGSYMPNVMGAMEQFSSNPDNRKEANNAGNFVWRSAWDIPELTKITAQALRENDPAARSLLFTQMQEQFIEAVPAVFPMFERFQPIGVSKRVEGYHGHPQNVVRLDAVTKTE